MMGPERTFKPPTTVGQLIEALRQFPAEQRVLVRGYESGFDDPDTISAIFAKIDPDDSSVYGDYENADAKDEGSFSAVLINR